MRLLIIGPQGAGKGTQATLLSTGYGIPHVSTGDLFREHIQAGSAMGRTVRSYTDAGSLVPDEVTQDMVADRLAQPDAQGGFLLDGFPRNLRQAAWLDDLLLGRGESIDVAVLLTAPDEVLMDRMLARGRPDDTPEAINRRLDIYHRETEPLIDHYGQRVVSVDGRGDITDVHQRIRDAIEVQRRSEV